MHCDCSMQQPRQTALLEIQSKPFNTVTEGLIESVHIKRVEFRENLRAFFPQGQISMGLFPSYMAPTH